MEVSACPSVVGGLCPVADSPKRGEMDVNAHGPLLLLSPGYRPILYCLVWRRSLQLPEHCSSAKALGVREDDVPPAKEQPTPARGRPDALAPG